MSVSTLVDVTVVVDVLVTGGAVMVVVVEAVTVTVEPVVADVAAVAVIVAVDTYVTGAAGNLRLQKVWAVGLSDNRAISE